MGDRLLPSLIDIEEIVRAFRFFRFLLDFFLFVFPVI